jgi:hypothetical protein
MTMGDYIKIINDIDGYIARGGKLLDLQLVDPPSLPPPFQNALDGMIDPAAAVRIVAFLKAVGNEPRAKERKIGEVITEERLQEIWCGTAGPLRTKDTLN